jgi:hypothetical protein
MEVGKLKMWDCLRKIDLMMDHEEFIILVFQVINWLTFPSISAVYFQLF